MYAVLLFVFFLLYPVCNFGKLINFGLSTVRSERVESYANEELGL